MTSYRGIDYSGPTGTCNRDPETGIRYGILSANSLELNEWFWESVESVYSPHCGHCGGDLDEGWDEEASQTEALAEMDLTEEQAEDLDCFVCPHCHQPIPDGEQYGDEPDGNVINEDGIEGFVDSSNDVWITKSPYFTYAQFCSPCAPGAVHLGNPLDETSDEYGELLSNRGYCLGHDWFQDKAPYPVYSVETGQLVS